MRGVWKLLICLLPALVVVVLVLVFVPIEEPGAYEVGGQIVLILSMIGGTVGFFWATREEATEVQDDE